MAYSSAGHEPALLLRGCEITTLASVGGLPLGVEESERYEVATDRLAPGRRVVRFHRRPERGSERSRGIVRPRKRPVGHRGGRGADLRDRHAGQWPGGGRFRVGDARPLLAHLSWFVGHARPIGPARPWSSSALRKPPPPGPRVGRVAGAALPVATAKRRRGGSRRPGADPRRSAHRRRSRSFVQPLELHVVIPVREVEVAPVDLDFAALEVERLAAEGWLGRLSAGRSRG